MKTERPHLLSKRSLEFLVKAGRQKNPDWLERNQEEYDEVLRLPFIALAEKVKEQLQPLAPDYHFPTKGLARIKRPNFKVKGGQPLYKDWISMIASPPSRSRFETHPHLFFGLFPNEPEHPEGLVAGGLWMPTSPQTRQIRLAIAADSQPFHELLADREFKSRFKTGFYMDEVATRVPRGFAADHPDVEWIKLKKFVVMKKVSLKELASRGFGDSLVEDFKQALRFNHLLSSALRGEWPPEG